METVEFNIWRNKKMKKLLFLFFFSSVILAQSSIIDLSIDKRLFISYAFMNAAGNSGEWRKEGMNPLRIEVRNILKERIDTTFINKIHKYVFDHELDSWVNYGPYALINNGPPKFDLEIDYKNSNLDSNAVNMVKGLQDYFVEFYNKYNIEELWKKYYSSMQAENQKYAPFADRALSDIINYCRISDNYFSRGTKKIHYQVIPLMSYFTAQTVKVNGEIYIISGPTDGQPSEANFYHEALHHPIGEIVNKYSNLINKYSEINNLNKGELGYPNWLEFFEECLVRTIANRMSSKLFNENNDELLKGIYSEYKKGLILCPYLNEELEKYETANIPLEKYFPELLTNLDLNKEKEKLDEYNKTRKEDK